MRRLIYAVPITLYEAFEQSSARTMTPVFGRVLSVAEAARFANVGEADVAAAIESGDLPSGEGALGPYVKRSELLDFLKAGGFGAQPQAR